MSEAYLTNWAFGGETPDTRNRFHETALREARIATEYHSAESRGDAPAMSTWTSVVARLRHAFGGPAAVDSCNCPV